MYNLNKEEINLVDGGGDGGVAIAIAVGAWALRAYATSKARDLYNHMEKNGRSQATTQRTAGQTYGGNGRDTNGNMMM
jgi:hypothetical protein